MAKKQSETRNPGASKTPVYVLRADRAGDVRALLAVRSQAVMDRLPAKRIAEISEKLREFELFDGREG
jgi:hypothetical protein